MSRPANQSENGEGGVKFQLRESFLEIKKYQRASFFGKYGNYGGGSQIAKVSLV